MFEDYENLREIDKKTFTAISNKLMTQCFIVRKNDKKDYRFISRYKQMFDDYFEILDFRLEENPDYGVFQLVSNSSHNRKQFNLAETIVLLVLRIIYDEKKRELSLTDDIITNSEEIQEKILAVRDGRNISKTDLRNALSTFKRYNIINYGKDIFGSAFSLSEKDLPIIIYDSIVMAVPVGQIVECVKLLNAYMKNQKDFYENIKENKTN